MKAFHYTTAGGGLQGFWKRKHCFPRAFLGVIISLVKISLMKKRTGNLCRQAVSLQITADVAREGFLHADQTAGEAL